MINKIKKLFSNNDVNTGRQTEFDLAKGFAIIFMVWVHSQEMLTSNLTGVMPSLVENFLGGPFAAPIFMICLGIGIAYSRKNKPGDLRSRGVNLLLIGFVLNMLRSGIPYVILLLQADAAYRSTVSIADIIKQIVSSALFTVDILQFAGLAFLYMAVVKALRLNQKLIILSGMILSLLGMQLRWVTTGNALLDRVLGYLYGNSSDTYFPFLHWLIFPIMGYVFAIWFRKCSDKKTFYRYLSPIAAVIAAIYLYVVFTYGVGMFSDTAGYYFLGIIDAFFIFILAIAVFGFDYALIRIAGENKCKLLLRMSRNVNSIYCIHWVLMPIAEYLLFYLIGLERVSFGIMTATALTLLILSELIAEIYGKWKVNRRDRAR